ncbi:ATP-dependent DNA helicase [Mycolicibacterium madagascariense]|uniref:DNA 3'-5' helicase n=1 Tax=Mycolicibacterium madagascariense TaxID=212765 RepID=A0A7I7XEG2_9MYCO|nr:ATP-dependent DNA helicase [Mycolicibacterium madagascariense]MCV7014456.1 ATP-dependent helicase [Mycolicibacterium madagascariense]BBZ27248.1 ATP-dependent DNA helicase [Mycolicibacterium madagascariense]
MSERFSPAELAEALGIFAPTDEQAAVIAAPPGPLVVIAGAGAGKTETMAARVVWLVANGHARPGEVLGLTFTRKAAGQLLRRVRTRLSRLAGAGLIPGGGPDVDEHPTIGTYHAFAGTLLREHGLLLPVEPSTRLIGATELWQLAFRVVCEYPTALDTEKSPAAITAMVLRLAGQLAEHLVDTDQLRDTHVELERLVHTLPPGPRQRDTGPSQALLKMLAVQDERTEIVPLVDALHQRMRAENVMDFGMQMAAAARLAERFPRVGEQLRQRYRVVLLDEYQDTGHAQRVALSSLFGGGVDDELALTAVGDPIQSIYGWRGASATNLPRFTTDFCLSDGTPAPTLELRTSWRNPPRALHLANAVSAEARRRSVAVRELLPRPGAQPGTISCALLSDVSVERDWLADELAQRYHGAVAAGADLSTTAVLVRRNADAAPIADALTARGVPVEVVGLSGLLSIPEVADVVAMLRLTADPTAGSAAVRILTGPRWRLGAADVAALWRRAVELDSATASAADRSSTTHIVASAGPDADRACLADAICHPGAPDRYSAAGHARITALGRELTALRAQLHHPLPELIAEIRWTLGVDAEVRAAQSLSTGWGGTEHLDAFADVAAEFASRPSASVGGFLAFLDAAMDVENGLAPAEITVAKDRVQILTVHAAKGLEWQVVAVPHLSGRVFPSTGSARTWLSDPGDLPPLLRGDRASVSEHGVPVLDTSDVCDRKALTDAITAHRKSLDQRRIDEERRLLYVALTRAEDTLMLSGHHWGATESTPRGPSDFLLEIKDVIDRTTAAGDPCGVVEQWAPAPADGDVNPLRDNVIERAWPVDALGADRRWVDRGAELVTRAMAAGPSAAAAGPDVEGWVADVDALLAERAQAQTQPAAVLPPQLSVSALVDLGRDRDGALRRLQRRLPVRPDPQALLGTAFHEWVQRFFHAERLFDLEDLPGAVDGELGRVEAERLAELQSAFALSPWASRIPIQVEVPFDMIIGTTVVRGRIDAVFADDDGGVTVLDWKTGDPPSTPEALQHNAIQLAVYRLAWAETSGMPVGSVRAAFHYVRSGRTVAQEGLPDADALAGLLQPPSEACCGTP